jgi:hypothetical protein
MLMMFSWFVSAFFFSSFFFCCSNSTSCMDHKRFDAKFYI